MSPDLLEPLFAHMPKIYKDSRLGDNNSSLCIVGKFIYATYWSMDGGVDGWIRKSLVCEKSNVSPQEFRKLFSSFGNPSSLTEKYRSGFTDREQNIPIEQYLRADYASYKVRYYDMPLIVHFDIDGDSLQMRVWYSASLKADRILGDKVGDLLK